MVLLNLQWVLGHLAPRQLLLKDINTPEKLAPCTITNAWHPPVSYSLVFLQKFTPKTPSALC